MYETRYRRVYRTHESLEIARRCRDRDPLALAVDRRMPGRETFLYPMQRGEARRYFAHRQGGRCGICGVKPRYGDKDLALDHDHKTGVIRGLLCSKCNLAIGALGDTVTSVATALDYLLRGDGQPSVEEYLRGIVREELAA